MGKTDYLKAFAHICSKSDGDWRVSWHGLAQEGAEAVVRVSLLMCLSSDS